MKPVLETIQPNLGNSFFLTSGPYGATEPFWHIHPEYEIVYIKNGSAEQHVGSHYSKYANGTLLFIGPNIPHSNMGNFDCDDNLAVVIQMSRDFLENKIGSIQEFSFINDLINRSKQGIWFGPKIQNEIKHKLESINKYDSYNKLICLIDILKTFAFTTDYELLNANVINHNHESSSYNRVAIINKYVTENYYRTIQLRELAEITGLTESSFSRFFKKITGKTFVTFLNEYRVHKACELLTNNNSNISEVMYNTGFNEAAHFTRVFKKYTGYTPREYRAILKNSSRLKFE